jgi:ABC-2 type transport system ATP-binding protein
LHLDQSDETPALLILDEPTAGVDVELRRTIWSFLKELNEKGMTVMLTTHYLEEVEQLCKNLAVIDKGKIVAQTTVQSLMGQLDKQTFICDLKNSVSVLSKDTAFQMRLLNPHQLEVDLKSSHTFNQLFSYLNQAGIEITSLRPKTNRLETIFLDLIHR